MQGRLCGGNSLQKQHLGVEQRYDKLSAATFQWFL